MGFNSAFKGLNKNIHILLSQVYCVWQVVKTPTIISNNPVLVSTRLHMIPMKTMQQKYPLKHFWQTHNFPRKHDGVLIPCCLSY